MAKLTRATQKQFGSEAGPQQFGVFGSFAAGAPAYATTPAQIQSLSNFLEGWFGAVEGDLSPAIEDMNALFFLYCYQLCYQFQAGVAEWDSATTYFVGSLVNDGTGVLYASLSNNNLNNPLTDGTNWRVSSGSAARATNINPAVSSPYTLTFADSGKTFLVDTSKGAMQFNLPLPTANFSFTVQDIAGLAGTNPITLHRHGSESIQGLAADYVAYSPFGTWYVLSDGTNFYLE